MPDQTRTPDLEALKRLKAVHDNETDFIRQGHLYDQFNAYFWEFQFDAIIDALERAERVEAALKRLSANAMGARIMLDEALKDARAALAREATDAG